MGIVEDPGVPSPKNEYADQAVKQGKQLRARVRGGRDNGDHHGPRDPADSPLANAKEGIAKHHSKH